MTHSIVSFKSGFYGIKLVPDGTIIKADLIEWNGKKGTSWPYDTKSSAFNYYIDAENNVYYTCDNNPDIHIWCSGKRLNSHCHHLMQIRAR